MQNRVGKSKKLVINQDKKGNSLGFGLFKDQTREDADQRRYERYDIQANLEMERIVDQKLREEVNGFPQMQQISIPASWFAFEDRDVIDLVSSQV